jgi:signal transduction histidine kinase
LGAVLTSDDFAKEAQEITEAADKALKERPVFSIRMRLSLAFAVCFLLCLGITLGAIAILSDVQEKILFLEVAEDLAAELQQARRFEKNFLLYGTNLEEAREHMRQAQRLLERFGGQFRRVQEGRFQRTMEAHLAAYLGILESLQRAPRGAGRSRHEAALRDHGAEMLRLASELVSEEKEQVNARLSLARQMPLAFLAGLLVVMVAVGAFLARQILGTLSRFMAYTKRIAAGDFTPISPARKYRDEFSELALTMNWMLRELERHHRILLESHKLRAMGNLVAGVAHELNNPLNNILLSASLLREQLEALGEGERREMLHDLVTQADRARSIVRQLLDFARESEARLEPIDLAKTLEETQRLVGNQLKMKKIKLEVEVPPLLPPVHGDRQLLSQVLVNLILNAVDVLPEAGEIRIRADAERREGFLAVDVADNGPGIPEPILGQIFDPFFTTKPKGKGTGLGLSLSRGIVRRLGGALSAQSTVGKGTTFTLLLPVTTLPSDLSAPRGPGGAERQISSEGG